MVLAKRKNIGLRKNQGLVALVFLAPFLIGIFIFNVIPVLYSIFLSFVDFNSIGQFGNTDFVGFDNFKDVLGDQGAIDAYGRSLGYTLIYTPVVIVVGLILALLINRKIYFRGFSRTLMLIPYVANIMGIAIVFSVLLDPFDGPLTMMLSNLGMENTPMWLGDTDLALGIVALIAAWQNLPFQMIVYLTALQDVPKDLYEAAEIDGAGRFDKFKHITLPMISPTTFFLVVTAIIGSTQNFNYVATFTRGGPGKASTTYSYFMYQLAFKYGKYSTAIAMALIVFLFLLLFTLIQWRVQKKWVHY